MDFQSDINNGDNNNVSLERRSDTFPGSSKNSYLSSNMDKESVTEVVVNNNIHSSKNKNNISISFEKPKQNYERDINPYSNYPMNNNVIQNDIISNNIPNSNEKIAVQQMPDIHQPTSTFLFCSCRHCRCRHTYCCYNLENHCCSTINIKNCCSCCRRCCNNLCGDCSCRCCYDFCCRCNSGCCSRCCDRTCEGICNSCCDICIDRCCEKCFSSVCNIF